ncbi:MAG: HNH endonuclease, partial [Nocardioides sp.]
MEATTAAAPGLGDLDSPGEVLAAVRASRAAEHREAARQLRLAVDWAAMHSADSIHDAATLWAPRLGFEEEALPVAGEGAPLVAEFSVAEFAAALGMPTEVGRLFLGEALELRYRLPRLWKRVMAGDLAPWRARRIARETVQLNREVVAHVDRHVGPVAHRIGPAQTQRLIEEAIARHMPQTAEATRRQAADGRHFEVDHHQISFAGT